jgi:SNF2 family DNA or RNA helicase
VAGLLALTTPVDRRTVRARRDEEVSDSFWLTARAQWGSGGARPGEELEIPVERFVERLGWLAAACRMHGVSVSWDEGAERLVRQHRTERQLLNQVLERPEMDLIEETDHELAATRWSPVLELRDFQRDNLARLLALPHGANFSVPGAGKTAVTLALHEIERARGRVDQLLVVAPLSAFEAWQEEAARCLDPTPMVHPFDGRHIPGNAEIVLVNYQRMLFSYEPLARWTVSANTHLCLDEAHRIKRGRTGEWGSAALDVAYLAQRRDVLTGTPAPNGPRDLAVLLDFLWWGRGHEVLPAAALSPRPSIDVAHQIARSIRPLYVRTTKQDLELPEIEFTVQPVPVEGIHAELYAALRSQYAGRLPMGRQERAGWARMGEVVMYLLEAATNPGLLAAGSSDHDPMEFRHPPLPVPADSTLAELVGDFGAYETPRKFVELARLVNGNRECGRKTLVWSNFVRNLQLLERAFAALQPALVHGGVPSEITQPGAPRTREAELHRFRSEPDCWVLLANPAAMAEGVSLHTVCHDAVYLERTFNAGQYLQSLDRIHRLGLTEDTRVTFLVSRGTIDEAVAQRVRDKAEALSAMLNDPAMLIMSLPDEEDVGDPLDPTDAADVAALFAHLRGDD